jgi:plastocyanin
MARLMRRVLVAILLMSPIVATLPGCDEVAERTAPGGGETAVNAPQGEGAGATESAGPTQVSIDNFKYVPDTLTVPAGTRVTWTNHDDMPHTVTSTGKPKALDSEALDTDDQFSHVFGEPGTYTYICTVHPKMSGQVIVEAR